MNNRHVSSAILPAVIASSAVFSLLTLPFFFYRSQPDTVVDSLPFGQELQPIIASHNRDLTIRYIGGALVTSVMLGIGTVELWRRQKDRLATAEPQPFMLVPAVPQGLSNWESDMQPILTEVAFQPEFLSAIAEQPPIDIPDRSASESWPEEVIEQISGQITELSEEYDTCRIRVKQERRRQFAIQVAGQYYSFFRLLATKEAALETARQLSCRAHRVVVTPVEQQYAVWVWQPAAELELVSAGPQETTCY
jgi:hypothetical protein